MWFHEGKFTSDHIFTIRQVMEKSNVYGKDFHMYFVDLRQTYNNIVKNKLWIALEEFEIPNKLINLIKECNTQTTFKVKFIFEIKTGLKEGDALSPVLFNLALEKVIRSIRQRMECFSINTFLSYVDDIVIIGITHQKVVTRTNEQEIQWT